MRNSANAGQLALESTKSAQNLQDWRLSFSGSRRSGANQLLDEASEVISTFYTFTKISPFQRRSTQERGQQSAITGSSQT